MQINLKIYEEIDIDSPRRFYPSHVPIFDYEPLKDYFVILSSPEDIGEGVLSRVSFKAEDLICRGTGFFLTKQTLHTLQLTKNSFIHDPYFLGKLLHHCDPNCYLDMSDFSLHAIKDIKPFDRLTVDYNLTEDHLHQSFNCTCGSPNCQGWIEGKIKSE